VKYFIAYTFLGLFVALSFQQATMFTVYLFNKEYIAQQFCTNKDKPALKCNGKCHMNDILSKQIEKEENNTLVLNVIIPVYASYYTLELPKPILRLVKQRVVIAVLTNTFESKMFQPPRS
jgi:hypothetical protein